MTEFIEGRNMALTSLGGKLRKQGFEFPEIEAALLTENGRFSPALPAGEVAQIARSVAKYTPGEPMHRNGARPAPIAPRREPAEWAPIKPPAGVEVPAMPLNGRGAPDRTYVYRNESGEVLSGVLRWDARNGQEKTIRPVTYCRNAAGQSEWRFMAPAEPRPLYGLDLLAKNPEAVVILCEGEKCCDAINALNPQCVAVTFMGGAPGAKHADYSSLTFRRVILWPDADKPGQDAMSTASGLLRASGAVIQGVLAVDGKPVGWDAANAVAEGTITSETLGTFLAVNTSNAPETITEDVSPTWKQQPIDRFLNSEPVPYTMLCEGLPMGVPGFLFGEGGAFKSLAALWLGIHGALADVSPQKWLGKLDVTDPFRTMIINGEDQDCDLHHRLYPIWQSIGVTLQDTAAARDALRDRLHIFTRDDICTGGLDPLFADGKTSGQYEKLLRTAEQIKPNLIILDTLSRLFCFEENANEQGALVVEAITRIRDLTGATVLCVAHTNKGSRNFGKSDAHGQTPMRGASSLIDNSRWAMWFRAIEDRSIEILHAKGSRTKCNDPFKVKIEWPCMVAIEDGFDDSTNDQLEKLVEWVRLHPGVSRELARGDKQLKKLLGCGESRINALHKEAEEKSHIVTQRSGKSKGYYVPNAV